MRVSGCSQFDCSRSSDSARWLPRLLATTAWISSTMTVQNRRKHLAARCRAQQHIQQTPGVLDQDVRRLAQALLPLFGRRVAGTHRSANFDVCEAELGEFASDAGERRPFQIQGDVVGPSAFSGET